MSVCLFEKMRRERVEREGGERGRRESVTHLGGWEIFVTRPLLSSEDMELQAV